MTIVAGHSSTATVISTVAAGSKVTHRNKFKCKNIFVVRMEINFFRDDLVEVSNVARKDGGVGVGCYIESQ